MLLLDVNRFMLFITCYRCTYTHVKPLSLISGGHLRDRRIRFSSSGIRINVRSDVTCLEGIILGNKERIFTAFHAEGYRHVENSAEALRYVLTGNSGNVKL